MSMMDAGPPSDPLASQDAILSPPIQPEPIRRDPPEPDPARRALVTDLSKWARETKAFRLRTFNKMRRDMDFVRPGRQWRYQRSSVGESGEEWNYDQPYEANITQRHVQQRVAALYAKNPKVVARRRQRMDFAVWDGDQRTLKDALTRATGSPGDPAIGMPPMPPSPTPEDMMLLQDVEQGMNRRKMLDRVARTLEVLYTYFLEEGTPSFKLQAKQLIRRVEATGVGFVQLGFQRLMGKNPDITNRIRDDQARIDNLQMLAADLADEKITEYQKEADELRIGLTALQMQEQIVLREGLVFDFPGSTDILVDRECQQLKGFVGAKRVAREYHYTKDQIKAIFGVDIGTNYTQYEPTKTWQKSDRSRESNVACVWAIWDALEGVCYYVCDGYADFLKEPEPPQVVVDGFFPFKVLTFNDIEDPNDIYPPSDVEIVRSMQLEYNRSREGLREHRIANKPGYVAGRGLLTGDDKTNLMNHSANELIELNVSPDSIKEIEKLIAPRPTVPIQPEVYDAEYIFVDFQRVAGDQAANLGGTSDSTATEASIAETSRVSALQSCIDDVDDFLSDVARAGGQILFAEMSPQMVEKIVGPGAVWPTWSREEISEEIYLEIAAGSSGRPNKAVEIANWEKLAPYMMQLPGISQQWLLRQYMTRLDENVDMEDAFDSAMPSVVAQNAMATAQAKQLQPSTGKANDPQAQGPQGAEPAEGGRQGVDPHRPGPKPDFPVLGAPPPVGGD